MLYYVLISKGFKKYQIWIGELIRTKTPGAKFPARISLNMISAFWRAILLGFTGNLRISPIKQIFAQLRTIVAPPILVRWWRDGTCEKALDLIRSFPGIIHAAGLSIIAYHPGEVTRFWKNTENQKIFTAVDSQITVFIYSFWKFRIFWLRNLRIYLYIRRFTTVVYR